MHGLAVYMKEGLPFAWYLSLEKFADSYYVFDWLYFTHRLTSFSINHLLHLYARAFDSISSNMDEVLSINPSAVFVFGDCNVHHKD